MLRHYRERLGVSQTTLGKLAGFDHSFVARLEAGKREPSREAVGKLAGTLNLDRSERTAFFASAGYLTDEALSLVWALVGVEVES